MLRNTIHPLDRLIPIIQAREASGDIFARELCYAAFRAFEQADCDEVRLLPHVEPMPGSGWNRNQVIFFAQHRKHLVPDVKREQATAYYEKAHLVFGAVVLFKKFGAQLDFLRVISGYADDIDRYIASLTFQPLDLSSVGGNHFFWSWVWANWRIGLPTLKADTHLSQRRSDIVHMGEHFKRLLGSAVLIHTENAHAVASIRVAPGLIVTGNCYGLPGIAMITAAANAARLAMAKVHNGPSPAQL